MAFQKTFSPWGDPWRELARIQRDLERAFGGTTGPARESPLVNVFAGDQQVVLTVEIPGISPRDIDLTVTGDTVTLSGERQEEPVRNGESFHRRERSMGRFSRTLQLPFQVDPSKTEARYERGVLTVTLIRPEEQRARKVVIHPT